jgi:DNA mismatch repair protein MutL
VKGWEQLYNDNRGGDFEPPVAMQTLRSKGFESEPNENDSRFFQLKGNYILTAVKSGLMVIDQKRAHERILYEQYLECLTQGQSVAQKELFPQAVELGAGDHTLILESRDALSLLGLEITNLGQSTIALNSLPANLKVTDPIKLVEELLLALKEDTALPLENAPQRMALSMAKAAAIGYGRTLTSMEMQDLVDKLFACQHPNVSPEGKMVLTIISIDELEKRFR